MSKSKYAQMLEQYIKDINSGKIKSCHYTKKAIKRFQKDRIREKDADFLFEYHQECADALCEFAESLKPSDLNGRTLPLLPWQVFVLSNLEGWRYKDDPDRKRFRMGYVEIARKNSKTTSILEPETLYNFLKYPASESYLVSSRDDLAEKTYKEIVHIIKADKELDERLDCMSLAVTFKDPLEASRIGFFCDGAKDTDGFKPRFCAIDEFHAYTSDKILTSMQYGMRSKKDAQLVIITTGDVSTDNACYEQNLKSKRILNGLQEQEDYFTIIYTLDDEDDWRNPAVWQKANPSLYDIIDPSVIQADINDADLTPHKIPELKAKTFNIWGGGTVNSWMPLEKWQKNKDVEIAEDELLKLPCVAALDMAQTGDLCGFKLMWKLADGREYFRNHFYIPHNSLLERYKSENINFIAWVDNGIINSIPGDIIQKEILINDFLSLAEKYKIVALGYDPWQAKDVINKLEDVRSDIQYIEIKQSLANISPMFKDYESFIIDGRVIDNSPLSLWASQNVVIKKDTNDNYKPMKRSSASVHRIDPIVTATMCHGVGMILGELKPIKPMSFEELKAII